MQGNDLKIWLVVNGYNQTKLAEALGLSLKTVNSYCNGKSPKWLKFALIGLLSEGSNNGN